MTIEEAIKQADAIFALEGFQPSVQKRAIDNAVLNGRVTFKQAADEMAEYAKTHKNLDGFLKSRQWA